MWAAVVELLTDNLEGKGSNTGASWYREKFKKCRKKVFFVRWFSKVPTPFSPTTLSIMTLSLMTRSITILNITKLSITKLNIMKLSIMTLSIMTFSITTLSVTAFRIMRISIKLKV
jgi:hypothetical protein